MKNLLLRLVSDETGQDLIEYALLATLVGLVGVIGIGLIRSAILSTYVSWNTSTNDLWEPPNPI